MINIKDKFMKTKLFFALFVSMVLTVKTYSQCSFGVSPGIGLNSAYFGYKIDNKIVPYIGFQYLNAKFKYEESGERFDWDLYRAVSYSEKNEFSGSLYIPNIGVKYFVKQQNKLQAFFSLNFSKPLISGKLQYNGDEDGDFKDAIKNIKMWGGELGFGVEYFFDENFSIGGEFGLRYIHLKYNESNEASFYNPDTGNDQNTEIEDTFKFNMSPTFSRVSLNFYF